MSLAGPPVIPTELQTYEYVPPFHAADTRELSPLQLIRYRSEIPTILYLRLDCTRCNVRAGVCAVPPEIVRQWVLEERLLYR